MQYKPYIPQEITVHLGLPDQNAQNVTVSFPDYIKNVASSELYPTLPENAIRANIYAIVSFALNRIYTEWYRDKGYDFDVTSLPQYDQTYILGRNIFEPISRTVDDIFNNYLLKRGAAEPYLATFCNGTDSSCFGLSQWGSADLAKKDYAPYSILTYYYGNSIDIVDDTIIETNTPPFMNLPLAIGLEGDDVKTIQMQLNRISYNYPGIPKIDPIDGYFGVETENAVKAFQKQFHLNQTGIVDKATWYRIAFMYIAVNRISELNSKGASLENIKKQFSIELKLGDEGDKVKVLQYFLSVISVYNSLILPVEITGYFCEVTKNSVKSFQNAYGLPETGIVDRATWDILYRIYSGINENVNAENNGETVILYPDIILKAGTTNDYVRIIQQYLCYISKTFKYIPTVNATGYFGPLTKNAVCSFQNHFGLMVNGVIGTATWDKIAGIYSDLRLGYKKRTGQFPGYTIKEGS